MGIFEKFMHLKETISLFKEKLLDLGVVVYKTDTLRSCVEKMQDIKVDRDPINIYWSRTYYNDNFILTDSKVIDVPIKLCWKLSTTLSTSDDVLPDKAYLFFPDGSFKEIGQNYTLSLTLENRGNYRIIVGNCSKSFVMYDSFVQDYIEIVGNKVKIKKLEDVTDIIIVDEVVGERTLSEYLGIELPTSGEYEFVITEKGDYYISIADKKNSFDFDFTIE